ncbi:rhodanese-like domain-containing protein [Xenorhabdus szentirmaii]|uniref:hypothetical protein n=1 Tax=Xenorhabdus szentirmaii TaxID=290112 RepID=UPI002B4111C1|nr:hypothetical protein [Xenorhabdus sp. M]
MTLLKLPTESLLTSKKINSEHVLYFTCGSGVTACIALLAATQFVSMMALGLNGELSIIFPLNKEKIGEHSFENDPVYSLWYILKYVLNSLEKKHDWIHTKAW